MRVCQLEEVKGVIPQADTVEGRFGLLTRNYTAGVNFGSNTDLPGFRVPATAEEAKAARFCLTWEQREISMPMIVSNPSMDWSLRRGGFDQAKNTPYTSKIYTTYPGYMDNETIPSGTPSLAYGEGVYTIPSGQFVDNAALHFPGALVQVCNTAEDTTNAGKPKLATTWDERVIGTVEEFDATAYELTIRVRRG